MIQLTKTDYNICISSISYYSCTNCWKNSLKVYRLKGKVQERGKIGITLTWLCPDCFEKIIKKKDIEQVQFT
jgi:DNA-directed RNA polymerase subunit RPC12/RpoP